MFATKLSILFKINNLFLLYLLLSAKNLNKIFDTIYNFFAQ